MATVPGSSSSSSPTNSSFNTHSPRHRRNSRRPLLRSEPEMVHVGESSNGPAPVQAPMQQQQQQQQSGITNQQDDAAAKGKRPAWSKPSNGVVEVGPVMGAVSWPALSEAARASPKSQSSDSLVGLSDGSAPLPASSVDTNPLPPAPPTPRPTIAASIPNSNASSSYHAPARQKSMRRGNGGGNNNNNIVVGGPLVNGGGATLPCSSAVSAEVSTIVAAPVRPSVPEFSPRENHPIRNNGNWDHGSRSGGFSSNNHVGHEHNHRNYNHRKGNGGMDSGNAHNNHYGVRRNHDRGGFEWNSHRNFPGRDIPLQHPPPPPRLPQRPFIMPQPISAPFIAPHAVRPYGPPMGFHDMVYVPAPFIPPQVVYQPPPPDPQLHMTLLRQIEYYFSPENLCKDIYLRQNMKEEGWVPISIIESFNRIKLLTNNTKFILDTVATSSVLEVKGDKIRRRNDWANWLLPPTTNPSISTSSSAIAPQATYENISTRFNCMEIGAANQNNLRSSTQYDSIPDRSSGRFSSQSQSTGILTGEGIGQSTGQIA